MLALFAFITGLYYDLPFGYFAIGFIILLLDGDSGLITINHINKDNQ